jgi:hypothetical protein
VNADQPTEGKTMPNSWRYDDNLGTGGTPIAIGINPLDQYQLFFADINIKF